MRADIALHTAKQGGRDRYSHFDRADFERFREHFDLKASLRTAIQNESVGVEFQPIVDPRTQRVIAVEALVRWSHPERGPIPASILIAVAERSGLIQALDALVLRKGCQTLARLRARFPDLAMNVNVSSISLQDPQFVDVLRRELESAPGVSGGLRLELTESGLAMSSQALEEAAASLEAMGVGLVIDDFGAGASSLHRLSRLRAAGLKLDGSFVRDFNGGGGRICRAVVELARELDMTVTAEFVETEAQRRFVESIGCEAAQGYLYSASLAEVALIDWIEGFGRKKTAARTV